MDFGRIFGIMSPLGILYTGRILILELAVRGYCRHISNRITRNLRGGSRTRTIRIFTMTNVMDNICGEDALHFSTQRLMRVVLDRPNSELCYTGR